MPSKEHHVSHLCAYPDCRPEREPRLVLDQAWLCDVCRDHLRTNLLGWKRADGTWIHGLAGLHMLLEASLQATTTAQTGRVSGTVARGLAVNEQVIECRDRIKDRLSDWSRKVVEARQLTDAPNPDNVTAMVAFLARHSVWIAHHKDMAGEVHAEVIDLRGWARSLLQPSGVTRTEVGPCLQAGCPGRLIAVIYPAGEQEFPNLVCDENTEHQIPPPKWKTYERQLRKLLAERTA